MNEHPRRDKRSPRELRERLIGLSFEHDREDLEFWRQADETVRGKTLYELLARAEAILASVPSLPVESQRLILRKGGIERQPKA